MSNEALWEGMLETADYKEVSDLAVDVPKVLADVSMGQGDGVIRASGLLLTKEEIISLKRYVSIGFSFPTNLRDVQDFLRYGVEDDGGTGLTPDDFLSTFTLIRDHASTWTPLRERIMLTGTELQYFGASMRIWGQAMARFYESDEAIQLIKKHSIKTYDDLEKLEREWEGVFPGIALEKDTVVGLADYLKDICNEIDAYQVSTNKIKEDLDEFGNVLEKTIIPEIKKRLEFISTNKYPHEIALLDKQISERAEVIEALNNEYKALVEKSLASAASLNIVGLGMAIYLGVEAENVRAERTEKNKEQEADINSLYSKNITLGSLKRVEQDLQNCKVASLNAEVATNNLRHVWNVIDRYVNQSVVEMAKINDGLKLYKFMTTFARVVESWVKVEADAGELVRIFAEADEEFKSQGVRRVAKILAFRSGESVEVQGYATLDISLLSNSKEQMRSDFARATVLSEKYQYLPEVNAQFKRLVDNVFDSSRVLQETAGGSKQLLESISFRLAQVKKELAREVNGAGDDGTIEDIVSEGTQALRDVQDSVARELSSLSRSYGHIDYTFDRRETTDINAKLVVDIEAAQAVKSTLDGQLKKTLEDQTQIQRAIDIIEKAGIEEIGKEVNLTIDKVNEMRLAPVEAQLVLLAIEQLKKAVEGTVKNISFLFMLDRSRELRERVAALRSNIVEHEESVRLAGEKQEFIKVVHGLDDLHLLFKPEYKKSIEAVSLFVSQVASVGSYSEAEADRTLNEIEAFTAYLLPISSPHW
ncbi:hypothetical protein J3D47_005429 [Pseudomonas laurylsulfativorans]|uniref:alpha-xenorhabdolysin family binary toxin subunit A n=1 Tax=Pseudomonas laurylsulfativorans TaxID=1943631 RepID=UPI0020A12D13|nr:alpha-xenorhabdolysin family binary toxin subunit A [Pseudomonas laurylsulfativorans]MCP1421186.1 hypothetical protein [Pseudomonas laurylsulfativorans]